ncbi:MAG: sensor histidine kinase [Thermoplasmata archaeon]
MQNSLARAKKRPKVEPCPTPPRFAGEMLSVLSDIMSVEHPDSVLQKIASTVAELFAIRRLHVSVLDEHEQLFRIRAAYGFDPDKEKKIKKMTYSMERIKRDQDEKYRVAEKVYFVRPGPEEFVKGEELFYSNVQNIHKPRTDPNVWHELDYLMFVFDDRNGRLLGYIEIEEPESLVVPDAPTIEAMKIFSELAGVAIENSRLYQKQMEIAQHTRFLADIIGHDINNYNQAVTSYLQMAMNDKSVPEQTATFLKRASTSAWGISELIQRANKLMKIEEKGAEGLGPMELGEVLRESIDEVLMNYPERNVKIDLKMGNHRYFVTGNELANDIFTNILENAIEYDPHDKVRVETSIGEFSVESRRYWCVSVADNGIGIPDSKKKVVFGRYSSEEKRPTGSGLGLSIVRAIVEAYGGMVWVEDRVSGDSSKGSVFRVALPVATAK